MIITLIITLYLLVALITFIGMSYWAYIEKQSDERTAATVIGTAVFWPLALPMLLCMAIAIYALPCMFKLFQKLGFKARQ